MQRWIAKVPCRTVASREHLMRRWDTLFVNHARAFGWLPAAVRPGASGACVCTADAFGAFNKLREVSLSADTCA